MIKRVGMFTRRAGIDRSQFSRHWLAVHRRIVVTMPGMDRYIQNHCYDPIDQPFVNAPAYQIDGIAEMWWPDSARMEHTFASDAGRFHLQNDEPNFMGAISIFVIQEDAVTVIDGSIKVIAPMKARPGREAEAARWRTRLRQELPFLLRSAEGQVIEARTRRHLPADDAVPDAFLELRFESVQAAEDAVTSARGREFMEQVGDSFMKFAFQFVAEHRIF